MRSLRSYSQSGMTLVEILIGTALLGGVSLLTMKLMGDQASNQAYLKTSAAISGTLSKVESYLTNPETCRLLLQTKVIPPLPATTTLGTAATDAAVLSYTRPGTGGVVNVLGEANYGDFSIPNNGIKLQESAFGRSIGEMVITFSLNNRSFLARGRDDITKRIQFVVQKNPATNVIENCGPVLKDSEAAGKQKMCDSLGATADPTKGVAHWDATTGRCILNSVSCPFGQVATKLTSLGGIICEPLAGQINLNEIIDTSTTNCAGKPNLQIINQGGKFKINCY